MNRSDSGLLISPGLHNYSMTVQSISVNRPSVGRDALLKRPADYRYVKYRLLIFLVFIAERLLFRQV